MFDLAKLDLTGVALISCAPAVAMDPPVRAEGKDTSFCQLLDTLHSARNHTVTVKGELVGSFRHGFYLALVGHAEICSGWPGWGFTRRALLCLAWNRRGLPPEFEGLRQLHRDHRHPIVVVTMTGRIEADSLVLTYRMPAGKWLPLIGGCMIDPTIPGVLAVERVESWTIMPDSSQN